MTGCFDRRVRHVCKLVVDGKVASGFLIVDVSVEVQVDRNHEVVVAVIACGDRYFGSVGFSEELLDQIVTTQVA